MQGNGFHKALYLCRCLQAFGLPFRKLAGVEVSRRAGEEGM